MKDIVGSPGTRSGLALRVSQFACAMGSMFAMTNAFGFSNYSAYLYLTFAMALVILWTFLLLCVDIHALKNNRDLHRIGTMWKYVLGDWNNRDLHRIGTTWKYVLGDWIFGMFAFTAASAGGGLVILMERDVHFCNVYPYLACSRYMISVILTWMAWSFLAGSAISTMFLMSSLHQQ